MSKQFLQPQQDIDISGCLPCKRYKNAAIFDLCEHPQAEYKDGSKSDQHTCQHMRSEGGLCGPGMQLRQVR